MAVVRDCDIWNGALVGRRIQVAFWRVAASDVPREREARVTWIYDAWACLDAWLTARLDAPTPEGAP